MNVALRIQLLIGLMCTALVVYFVLLGRTGITLIGTGTPVAIALGVGVLILPVVGAWAMVATLPLLRESGKLARANVSMDAGLLASIDEAASARGLTRSSFLASAARDKLKASF